MPDPVKKYSLKDLDSAVPIDTQKPIKPIKYSLEDLDNAIPVAPINDKPIAKSTPTPPTPDYDQQFDNKIAENKAAESGLVDNIKPFTPELFQAKQDKIQPFIKDADGANGKQSLLDIKAMEAQTALDKEVEKDKEIELNAIKLGLKPDFLKQVVNFNNTLIPVSEDKKQQESYLFGTLASLNQGLSTIFDTVDQAATLLSESTGFKWKNPLFKDISKALKSVGEEGGYAEPETIVGNVAGSIASFAPDIMITYMMPEMKMAQMGILTKGLITSMPKFPAWLGAKTGLQLYNQTGKSGDLYYGAAKGFTEGLTYQALGILGNEAGALAKSMRAGQLASTVTSGIATGTLFGGHSVVTDPEVWNNGNINWEKAKDNFWTNFGVGLAFHGQKIGKEILNLNGINSSATRKAYAAYWTSNNDMIKTGLESKKTQRELRKESNKYWRNATLADNPVERNQNLLAKAAIDNIILTRPIADMVAKNPKKFREVISSDKRLNDEQKKFFLNKIDDTVDAYKANEEINATEGNVEKDYSVEGKQTSKKNVKRIVDQAESMEELRSVKVPEEDVETKAVISAKRKEIHQQELETVKAELKKKKAAKKSEISEVQPTEVQPVTKSEQKSATVKEEKQIEMYGKDVETKLGTVNILVEPNTESPKPNSIKITAYQNDKPIGVSTANIENGKLKINIADIRIPRKGIYSKIVDEWDIIAKERGLKLVQESGQTKEAIKFWENRNKEKVVETQPIKKQEPIKFMFNGESYEGNVIETLPDGKVKVKSAKGTIYRVLPEDVIKEKTEAKKETVEKQPTLYDKVTETLGLTKPVTTIEGNAKSGKIGGVDVILNEGKNENEIVLESIKTPSWLRKGSKANPKGGKATAALKQIIKQADLNQMSIRLRAVPEKGSKITPEALKAFYKKNGFVFKEGSDEGIRSPKGKEKPNMQDELLAEIEKKRKENPDYDIEIQNQLVGEVSRYNKLSAYRKGKFNISTLSQKSQLHGMNIRLIPGDSQRRMQLLDSKGKLISKKIQTGEKKQSIQKHKVLNEYDPEMINFVKKFSQEDSKLSFQFYDLDVGSFGEFESAIKNILNGKQTSSANSLLDKLESAFKKGEIETKTQPDGRSSPPMKINDLLKNIGEREEHNKNITGLTRDKKMFEVVEEFYKNDNVNWESLKDKIETDEGYFTKFPFGLKLEEIEKLKTIINDEKQRQFYEEIIRGRTDEEANKFLGSIKGEKPVGNIEGVDGGIKQEKSVSSTLAENKKKLTELTTQQAELQKKVNSANSKYQKLKDKLQKLGRKGQVDVYGNIAGSDVFNLEGAGIEKKSKQIVNEAKKAADDLKVDLDALTEKVDRLKEEINNQQFNQGKLEFGAEKPTEKQPWEMTSDEFQKSVKSKEDEYQKKFSDNFNKAKEAYIKEEKIRPGKLSNEQFGDYLRMGGGILDSYKEIRDKLLKERDAELYGDNYEKLDHKKQVQKAKSEGKTIPDNVKAEYPELFEAKPEVIPEVKAKTPAQLHAEELEIKKQDAIEKMSKGFSDLADLLGAKKNLTGEERQNAIKIIQNIAEGFVEYAKVRGIELIDAVKEVFKEKYPYVTEDLIDEALKDYKPIGGKEDAISIEITSPSLLGQERQKVELQSLGKRDTQYKETSGKGKEKEVIPPAGGNKKPPKPPKKGKGTTVEQPPPSVNPVVDKNMKAARGLKTLSFSEKLKKWGKEIGEIFHHFKYVRESEYPSVYNKLRIFESIPERVKKEAYGKIMEIMKPIAKNKTLYSAFERNVILRDLLNDIDNTELFKDKELPWEYNNAEEIRQDAANIQDYVNRNPELKKVVEARREMMGKITDALIENNLLKADTKENENYFHHQVLAYMADYSGLGVGSRDVRLHKKGWQRSRTGSMQDYNTNYIESEFEVLAQSLEQIEIKSILNRIGAEIDIKPQLEKLAESEGGKWKDYIPEGYTDWHPKSGTNAFKAASVAEKAAQRIVDQMGTPEDMKLLDEMLAESEKTTWIIPEKVAAQLDEMKTGQKEMILSRFSRGINSSWKQWVLMNPYRVLKYNLNNMSGDLDITLAYDPKILLPKYAHTAMKELWADLKGKGMSQDIKECLENGVITTGLSIQEIPNINNEGVFKSLTGKDNLIMKYWNSTKDYTQFRENLLRVASYKYFKEQLGKGKNLYGASSKVGVDALTDINEKAGKLARELIGDYGNISQGGQWLRTHMIPFFSWVEINSPRYYRLLKNTQYEGRPTPGAEAGMVGKGAVKVIFSAAKLTAKVMVLGGLVTLWNRTFFNDEDEELTKTGNRQLRLIVGRREDGSIMTIRISGAFSDMLAFVGLEDVTQDIKDVREGDATVSKKLKEGGSAFVNKLAQGVMPIEKSVAEMVLGKTMYPDIFNPRPIRDRVEHGLKTVSMDKIYRYLTKKPLRGAKELTGLIIYDTNPGEAAYYTMRQKIYDYLDENEVPSYSGEPTKIQNALYYYKQSLKLKDEKLAKYWHDKYMKLGGSDAGEKSSITKGKVISALPLKYREKWLSTLDNEDKEVLKMANDWYSKTYKLGMKESSSKPKPKVLVK